MNRILEKFQPRKNLTMLESKEFFQYYKIPVVKSETATSIQSLVEAARRIGYPIVLKILSPDILHKTEAGGVVLDIKDDRELAMAYTNMLRNVKTKFPQAKIDGFIVQSTLKDGYEIIIGGKYDPTFGPVVMLGFGGIFVELFNDVAFRVAPLTREDALDMIEEIKSGKILKGFRGRKPADLNAIVDIILKVSRMMAENPEIRELDINPVIANEREAVAVDARIILK